MAKVEITVNKQQLMQDVTTALGWTFHPVGHMFDNDNWGEAEGPGGMQISMSFDTYRGRFQISPMWPRDESNNIYPRMPYNQERVGMISVSPDKTAFTIARDIKSRLLPDFEKQYKEGIAQLAEHNVHVDGQTALWTKLCNFVGDDYGLQHDRKFDVYPKTELFGGMGKGYINSVRVDGPDSVRIELWSMSALKAEAILRLLKEWKE